MFFVVLHGKRNADVCWYGWQGGAVNLSDRKLHLLTDDESARPKQRPTMKQVYRRLVAEQVYRGGYDAVRRYTSAGHTPTF